MPTIARALAATLAAVALAAWLVVPVMGKEFLVAHLDAPIAFDTPPGTEILVGVTVTGPDQQGLMAPVDGSPIQLILTGRDGSRTRSAGAADRVPGHYVMRIAIPGGGARGLEVVMHGTSDLPIMLDADPFTFGGVTAGTAQVAPPLAPPMTPIPRASTPAAVGRPAAAPVQAPVAVPAPAATDAPGTVSTPIVLVAGLVVLVAAIALASAAVRRSRASRVVGDAGRAPGA